MKAIHKTTLTFFAAVTLVCFCAPQASAHRLAFVTQDRATMLQYIIENQPGLGELIAKAGLAPTLSGDAAYTFLMPSEAELNNLKNESAQRVRTILSGHILKGKYLESDLKDGATIETLAGTKVTVCRKKDYTLVNGIRIITSNNEVKNGVVHKLSGVIKG